MNQFLINRNAFIKAFILVIFSVSCALISKAQDTENITYDDYFSSTEYIGHKASLKSKEQRSSSLAATIVPITSINDDNILKCIEYCINIWGTHIISQAPIHIEFELSDQIEADIKTDVKYKNKGTDYYPTSLYFFLYPNENYFNSDITRIDGKITINSLIDWDYSIGSNISENKKNLTSSLLKSVARVFGCGSSVSTNNNSQYFFSHKRGYNCYDKLIQSSDNIQLSEIPLNGGRPNQDLTNYIDYPNRLFKLNTKNKSINLASPPYSQSRMPFSELNEPNSLLSIPELTSNHIFQIDDYTQCILEEIGWDISSPIPLFIKGADITDNGLASAYKSHSFYVEGEINNLKNTYWVLSMPLSKGGYSELILDDTDFKCTVPAIEDEKLYKININGDIEGNLTFIGDRDGMIVKSFPFKIYFELKPLIENVEIINVIDNSPYDSYDVHYRVKYRGADMLRVSVDEEYGSHQNTSYITEPVIATGITNHITSPFYAWIDFVVTNKYGRSSFTLEFEPYGIFAGGYYNNEEEICLQANNLSTLYDIPTLSRTDEADLFKIYDLNGVLLFEGNSLDRINIMGYRGLIIIQSFYKGDCVCTKKHFIK